MTQRLPTLQRFLQDDRPGLIKTQAVGHPKLQSYFRGRQSVCFQLLSSLTALESNSKSE